MDLVGPQWYIETDYCVDGNAQAGDVLEVIRDKFGIPVCFKITDGENGYDWVSADRVEFFEPFDRWVSDVSEYITTEEFEAMMAAKFVKGDDGEWYDPDTGEVVVY